MPQKHLPQLTGTDKQVQWATMIRAKANDRLDIPQAILHWHTDATWWIDNRKSFDPPPPTLR